MNQQHFKRTYQMGAQFRLRSLQQEPLCEWNINRKKSIRSTRNANLKIRHQTEQMTVLSKIELSHHGKDQVQLIYESYPVVKFTKKQLPSRSFAQSPQLKNFNKTISFDQVKRMLKLYINS